MKAEKVNTTLKNLLLRSKSPRENAFFAIFGAILDEIQKMQCTALNIAGVYPAHNICMKPNKIEYTTFKFTAIHPSQDRQHRGRQN
jgi:hypothetical protein